MNLLRLKLLMLENVKNILQDFDSPSAASHDELIEELEKIMADINYLRKTRVTK